MLSYPRNVILLLAMVRLACQASLPRPRMSAWTFPKRTIGFTNWRVDVRAKRRVDHIDDRLKGLEVALRVDVASDWPQSGRLGLG